MHKYLAVIPARANSKRLPRKNLLSVGGRTLIGRAADSFRESEICKRGQLRLIFSTEDDELAEAARVEDLEVVMRPPIYAEDGPSVWQTVQYVYRTIQSTAEISILAHLTSPFRRAWHVDAVAQALEDNPTIRHATTVSLNPFRLEWMHRKRGQFIELVEVPPNVYRPDPEMSWCVGGGVNAIRGVEMIEDFTDSWPPIGPVIGVEVPQLDNVDIDYEIDYLFAEYLAREKGL